MLYYYNIWEGNENIEAIIDRYDEAAKYYRGVKGKLKTGDNDFIKRIVSMIDARDDIDELQLETPDGATIPNGQEQKNKVLTTSWDTMRKNIDAEENDSNKVNLYMLMSSVVYDKRTDFDTLDETKKQEIIEYCQSAKTELNSIKSSNQFSENIKDIMMKKIDASVNYFDNIQKTLNVQKDK